MIKQILGAATALSFYTLTAGSALAQDARWWWGWDWSWGWDGHHGSGGGAVASVPEIDAGSGFLALAAVAALIALFYELRRRRVDSRDG